MSRSNVDADNSTTKGQQEQLVCRYCCCCCYCGCRGNGKGGNDNKEKETLDKKDASYLILAGSSRDSTRCSLLIRTSTLLTLILPLPPLFRLSQVLCDQRHRERLPRNASRPTVYANRQSDDVALAITPSLLMMGKRQEQTTTM